MCDGCEQYELNDALSRANKRGDDLWQRLLDAEAEAAQLREERNRLQNRLDIEVDHDLSLAYRKAMERADKAEAKRESLATQLEDAVTRAFNAKKCADAFEARAEKAEARVKQLVQSVRMWTDTVEARNQELYELNGKLDEAREVAGDCEARAEKAEGLAKKYVEAFADEFVTLLEKWDLETSPDLQKSLRQWRAGETRPVEDVEASLRRGMADAAAGRVSRRDDLLKAVDEHLHGDWPVDALHEPKREASGIYIGNDLDGWSFLPTDGSGRTEAFLNDISKATVWTGNDRDGWKCVGRRRIDPNRSYYRDVDGDVWTGNDRDGWKCIAIDGYVCESRSLDELREDWGPLTEVTE
jgi:hypothetical protein